MAIAVMFPGQGAQRPGWGRAWRDDEAWSVVEQAERALDRNLNGLLLDADAPLTRTEDAQLSVLVASLVAWQKVRPLLDDPVAFAGHSLGQITALIAAGALPLDDGLRLAARRAGHTQRAADRSPGRMVALLGATAEQAEAVCAVAPGACWVANDNAPGQVVVAGTPEGVEAAVAAAPAAGVRRTTVLPVGGAFHTPLMEEARLGFAEDLAGAPLVTTATPVVSNGDARPYTDGEGWRRRLADHLVSPVRWRASVETLVTIGATELVEVGPGATLAGLARRIAPDTTVRSTEDLVEARP
ncbi:MAG TPA: ACP S-malonyltransferase [Acidimicrobiales bacterium]|nr:ACP S-malonyltransferase [Acidimicrobiales bacterium]